ncbi:hypothetical protein FRC11_014350, partial [Ceratobasidium sp. 423]
MSRTGPPHYHQGSNNICHCAFLKTYYDTSASYHNTPAPFYPSAPSRPRPVAGHSSDYGHAINMPNQNRPPVFPGGPGKPWGYQRAPPPPPVQNKAMKYPHVQVQPQTWIKPVCLQRYPAAPQYAGGSAHPASMRLPSGTPPRVYAPGPLPEFPRALQEVHHLGRSEHLGRYYVDASAHRGYPPPEDSSGKESEDGDDESDYSHGPPEELHRPRVSTPHPFPNFQELVQELEAKGFRVDDPHTNAAPTLDDGLDRQPSFGKHGHSASAPNVLLATYEKVDIHRLLQTRTTLDVTRMPDLVFDLRYDPHHAFDRSEESQKDLTTAPAFQPGQKFVRLLIRHPFGGCGGDWFEDVGDAKYSTVVGVLRMVADIVHRNIHQNLDWDPLSEFDNSFVYEAYLNQPCPNEDVTSQHLHLFCEKYMFGGIKQLLSKAKGTMAEGPTFVVKLIK